MTSRRWQYRPDPLTPWVRSALDPEERAHVRAVMDALEPTPYRVRMAAKSHRGPFLAVVYDDQGREHSRTWKPTPREALDAAVEGLT